MTHWKLFLLPEGGFIIGNFCNTFITKEAAVIFVKENDFYFRIKDDCIYASSYKPFLGSIELEKCLIEIVEIV